MDILDVEKNVCIGCGACIAIDEEHFDWDDDGKSKVISNDNLKSEKVTDAIESCPTGAIRLSKGQTYTAETLEEENTFNAVESNVYANSSTES